MSHHLAAHGVSLDLPKGWDAEFSGAAPPNSEVAVRERSLSTQSVDDFERPFQPLVVHAGNFRLPADRGDFGSGAVEAMGAGGVLVCLLEYDQASASTELFRRNRLPQALGVNDVQPNTLQRTISGQAGTQIFCAENGRAFCLYVVIGSHRRRAVLVPLANEVISSISIEA